jgi:hypothetical protein
MTINNDNKIQPDNMEFLKKEASACGPGCGCHAGRSSVRIRLIIGVIVLVAAGVLAARAVMKNKNAMPVKAASGFASLPTVEQVSAPSAGAMPATNKQSLTSATVAVQEINALSDLNALAADTGGVFVFLAGKNDPVIAAPLTQMRSAARTIEAQGRNKIGVFTLKTGSRDYEQIATQMSVPVVLAMVKGRGMIPVSGEITEAKLIQGFVAASRGGCGPSSAGCGPGGCN